MTQCHCQARAPRRRSGRRLMPCCKSHHSGTKRSSWGQKTSLRVSGACSSRSKTPSAPTLTTSKAWKDKMWASSGTIGESLDQHRQKHQKPRKDTLSIWACTYTNLTQCSGKSCQRGVFRASLTLKISRSSQRHYRMVWLKTILQSL